MKTHELLDRFELLYPKETRLSDLRRIYNDKDLSSLFRFTNSDEELRKAVMEENLHSIFRIVDNYDTEDLRKAVIEKNLHSIFRLVDDDDLRKFVLEDNTWKLWPILNRYIDTQFVEAFKNFFVNDLVVDKDCFSRGQLMSKLWLVNEISKLNLELGTVFLTAGWYATLAVMLFESKLKVDKIRSFDIDPAVWKIAEIFNKPWLMDNWKFKATTKDIMDIDYKSFSYTTLRSNGTESPITDVPDTIINTSCEHIEKFAEWYSLIPKGKLVILQSNDYFEVKEHLNCSKSLAEFSNSCPMEQTLFEGELFLPKYTRFMKIGYK